MNNNKMSQDFFASDKRHMLSRSHQTNFQGTTLANDPSTTRFQNRHIDLQSHD